MAKKQKTRPSPPPAQEPIAVEWVAQPATVIEPLPLRLTARQLAYLHSSLMLDVNIHRMRDESRRDEKSHEIIRGCLDAVHACMRDWWDRHEESTAPVGKWMVKTNLTVPANKP